MRFTAVLLLLGGLLATAGCTAYSTPSPAVPWTTGFWFWNGSSLDPNDPEEVLDVLFVQAGTIEKSSWSQSSPAPGNPEPRWSLYGSAPSPLPPAKEYWLVYRSDSGSIPSLPIASQIASNWRRLAAGARKANRDIVGIQLDIDSPTASLSTYAEFLRELRTQLPRDTRISITALLDWFRPGTAMNQVAKQVDEFVPQFYDVGDPSSQEPAVAAKIDAKRWGPVFNRLGKPFRIGISTFGRGRMIRRSSSASEDERVQPLYGDLQPLAFAMNPGFQLRVSHNDAGETVLTYQASRQTKLSYDTFRAGDRVQFILSTPETIRAAVASARQMGGAVAGVLFFRWPGAHEVLSTQPVEVLGAARGDTSAQRANRVHTISGECAAVECVDVYLESAHPLSPQPVKYRVTAATPLEYFLSDQSAPVRMVGDSCLEVTLPAYCQRGRLYLGRAVSSHPVEFQVEEEP